MVRTAEEKEEAGAHTLEGAATSDRVQVNVHVNELRLGFSNTTRNPEGVLCHTPVLVHTPCSIGMSHMAEYTCCSSVAFERPNENTFTFTFTYSNNRKS
jgi:hypothetical protein